MLDLFPYQKTGAAFLASRNRALLCDEMGLGKTPQAIRAADDVCARRILVLAPASVTANWKHEIAQWQTRPRAIVTARRPSDLAGDSPAWCIVSYDTAKLPAMRNALVARAWDVLVCDEAHMLKNHHSARARLVLGPNGTGEGGLLESCARAWGLTGTPMPNTADELWPLLRAFGPEALATAEGTMAYWPFRRRYCVEIPVEGPRGSRIVGVRNADELRAKLASVVLRRKAAEVLPDLPGMREGFIALDSGVFGTALRQAGLGDESKRALAALRASVLAGDDAGVDRLLRAWDSDAELCALRRQVGALKATALADVLVDEMQQHDDKLVVFGWHRETLDVLEAALSPFGLVRVDGSVPAARRGELVRDFQHGSPRVFLGNIQAAGTGITLTAACNLVFAEHSWTPADNAQAAMRVRRVGQKRPVLVRHAILAGTPDEDVVRALRRKTQAIQTITEQETT